MLHIYGGIESRNDMVASITGVTVRERIPDEVFD